MSGSHARPWMAATMAGWCSVSGAEPALPVGAANLSGGPGRAGANRHLTLRCAAMDGRHFGGMMFGQRSRAGCAGRRSQFERRSRMGRSESSDQNLDVAVPRHTSPVFGLAAARVTGLPLAALRSPPVPLPWWKTAVVYQIYP